MKLSIFLFAPLFSLFLLSCQGDGDTETTTSDEQTELDSTSDKSCDTLNCKNQKKCDKKCKKSCDKSCKKSCADSADKNCTKEKCDKCCEKCIKSCEKGEKCCTKEKKCCDKCVMKSCTKDSTSTTQSTKDKE
ncbi:MAG: hypothetical protein WDZ35_14950 [Crocinitomicaceae bacterium]